jgi:hypothetical protein
VSERASDASSDRASDASSDPAIDQASAARRRPSWRFVAAFALVIAAQLGVMFYFGGRELFEDRPVAGLDFDTHIHQAWRVVEGLHGWGRSWVWDPRLLAGYPTGTIFEADNIGWSVWTWLLVECGVSKGLAFNLFVVMAHVGLVPAVYLSGRWLDLSRPAALGAAAAALGLWTFDSWLHWCWYVGMVAYATASWFWLMPMALFVRWWRRRTTGAAIGCALLMALCHLVHPYSFFLLVTPLAVIYLGGARQLDRRGHLVVWGIAAFTVLANAWWLVVAAQWWSWILDSSLFGRRSLMAVVYDLFGLLDDPAVTGIVATRTNFRLLYTAVGLAGVVTWWRRGDPRAVPIGVTIVVLGLFAYVGGATPLSHIQPYRHTGPMALLALVPAAALVETAWREGWVRSWPGTAKKTFVGLLVVVALWLAQDVLYFTVRSLPAVKPLPHGEKVFFSAIGHLSPVDYSYANWHRDDVAVYMREHDDGQGRVLVEGWSWGEQLAWKTDSQILGGFIWRNMQHSWANILRHRPQGIILPDELATYFATYGVRWVVISTARGYAPWWDKVDQIELVTTMHPFRIYRVKAKTHLLDPPVGTVEVATNRIGVRGTDPTKDVLVRYHWAEVLRCEPDCRLERVKVKGDPVGFMKVLAPHPADFDLVNRY